MNVEMCQRVQPLLGRLQSVSMQISRKREAHVFMIDCRDRVIRRDFVHSTQSFFQSVIEKNIALLIVFPADLAYRVEH